MNRLQRLTEILDTNFGYVDEAPASKVASKLIDNGVMFADEVLESIVKHGQYAAAKWAGHATDRAYWEARYCGIAALYRDIVDVPTAYADFNAKCGVVFNGGHIISADGASCDE